MLEFPSDVGHATFRWVRTVLAVVDHSDDVKTIPAWGRLAGVSPSVIRSICLLAGTAPKQSLDFARIMRLITHRQLERIAESLSVDDPRTLRRLLVAGGIRRSTPPLRGLTFPHSFNNRASSTTPPCSARLLSSLRSGIRCRTHRLPGPRQNRARPVSRHGHPGKPDDAAVD